MDSTQYKKCSLFENCYIIFWEFCNRPVHKESFFDMIRKLKIDAHEFGIGQQSRYGQTLTKKIDITYKNDIMYNIEKIKFAKKQTSYQNKSSLA